MSARKTVVDEKSREQAQAGANAIDLLLKSDATAGELLAQTAQHHLNANAVRLRQHQPQGDRKRRIELASRLAAILTADAYPIVRQYLDAHGNKILLRPRNRHGNPWTIEPTPDPDPDAANVGLPLLGSLSPQSLPELIRILIHSSKAKTADADRHREANRLSEALLLEQQLWKIAADEGAEAQEIPYLTRYAAMLHWWLPETHQGGQLGHAICLRCGTHVRRRTQPRRLPLCPNCMKEPADARTWPNHAICPAGQGTWWLQCDYPDCHDAFTGRRNRRYCDRHHANRLDPKARHRSQRQNP